MAGMLDPTAFDPSTYGGQNAPPSWLSGAMLPAGMLAQTGAGFPPTPAGDAELPEHSSPTSGDAPPATPPSSFLGRLANAFGTGIGRNSNMLMAMGAGMMGAPSLGIGLSRGMAGAMQGHQEDIRQQMQVGGIGAMYQAFRGAGADPNQALLAAIDPESRKMMTPRFFPGAVTWQDGVPYDASGKMVNGGAGAPGQIITIKDPQGGPDRTARVVGGHAEIIEPQSTPKMGTPPIRAIRDLQGNKSFAGEFERKYGPGSAAFFQGVQIPQGQ